MRRRKVVFKEHYPSKLVSMVRISGVRIGLIITYAINNNDLWLLKRETIGTPINIHFVAFDDGELINHDFQTISMTPTSINESGLRIN